jgi:hypothetical protein
MTDSVSVVTGVWRRIDEPGMEIAYIDSLDRARGTQLGVGYELRWQLDGTSLSAELVGRRSIEVELEDADFFDVFASPFFNSLPVARDALLDGGSARDYTMKFLTVPALDVVSSRQRYEPRGDRVVRFSSGSFSADIRFGADDLVEVYDGFLERLS